MSQSRDVGGGDAPSFEDRDDQDYWYDLAKKHWSNQVRPGKVKAEVIKKDIWDRLENDGFDFRSLVALENLQLLEQYVFLAFGYWKQH